MARVLPNAAEPADAVAPLRDKPGYLVRRVHQRSVSIFDDEAREFGVTGPQHVVMVALAHHPHADQATIAALVDLDRWTTAGILSRLQQRGLVLREVNPADRRERRHVLSPAGLAMVRDMAGAIRRTQQRFLAKLEPDERREFVRLLRKVLALEP